MKKDPNNTYCYVFRSSGDLVQYFPCCMHTPNELPLLPDRASCFVRQQDFYTVLSQTDAVTFEAFCRGKHGNSRPKRIGSERFPTVPSLLLLPNKQFTAVFAERYTAQLLSHYDPVPGAVANAAGQPIIRRLQEQFSNHHLILTLLFSSLRELYCAASPLLASIPPLVQSLVTEMENLQDPVLYTDTLPFLKSYRRELRTADTPVFLDLARMLPRLAAWIQHTPQFDGLCLHLTTDKPTALTEEMYQVRFSVSVFTHVFVLLSYLITTLSDDSTGMLSLYRDGTCACLTFQAECTLLPVGFSCRNELYSLSAYLPHCRGLLTLVQYMLHRNHISFFCVAGSPDTPDSLEITLYMDTRFREEIEFRSGDVDALLSDNLPDALALLRYLTE